MDYGFRDIIIMPKNYFVIIRLPVFILTIKTWDVIKILMKIMHVWIENIWFLNWYIIRAHRDFSNTNLKNKIFGVGCYKVVLLTWHIIHIVFVA